MVVDVFPRSPATCTNVLPAVLEVVCEMGFFLFLSPSSFLTTKCIEEALEAVRERGRIFPVPV